MLAGGPALILFGAVLCLRRRRILTRARTTTGTVIDNDVRHVTDGCQPVVRYSYHAAGQDRTGTRVTPPPGEETTTACHKARRIAESYPPGGRVTVHYLPDAPDTAFLRRGGGWMWMIPMALGIALLVIAWQRASGA
jgi:hypothetical protein